MWFSSMNGWNALFLSERVACTTINQTRPMRNIAKRIPTLSFPLLRTFKRPKCFGYYNQEANTNQANLRRKTRLLPSNNLIPEPPVTSLSSNPTQDGMLSNKAITSYVKLGDLDSALGVFHNMAVKTTVTWNSILAGYSKERGRLKDAEELFAKIPEPDSFSFNIMLACYVNNSEMESAEAFFDGIPTKDTVSWNTMISGFAQSGRMDRAREWFLMMPKKNEVTWNAMVSGYVGCGDMDLAKKFFDMMPFKSVVAGTALITGYMKTKRIEIAERLFQEMPRKNLVTWNTMISGYVENCRADDGVELFRTMVGFGIRPSSSTLTSVLLGCSELSALQLGRQIHQLVFKLPLCNDTTAGTSLISMYSKCGVLEDAWKLFLEIPRKDVVTWNAMISGYAQHGEGKRALILFDEMKEKGTKPDWITFVAVLLACSHAGLVDLGVKYFHSMTRNYGVEAKQDHYICMVDLLGRAGRLTEAVDLIGKMPFQPHPAIFGTLLGACRIHKNIEIAEFSSKNLLILDPRSATGYVQLANVYAAMKKWDHVARVRRSMKDSKVVKTPGYSWIEIKGIVHEFRSSDRIHPELASIHKKLDELEKKMKLAGYAPDLEFALHNVEELHKEQLLLWHSEKLAIAYGLIKTPHGTPLRVFKNLRVCGDCHRATKYISTIEEREIIVRDTSRFHYFKDGRCSCADYW